MNRDGSLVKDLCQPGMLANMFSMYRVYQVLQLQIVFM